MTIEDWQALIIEVIDKPLGISAWRLIDQSMINRFADATGDRQAIHVDPEFAKSGPFGATVAHGFLLLSLVPELLYPILEARAVDKIWVNYGSDKLRFITPVIVDSEVRIHVTLAKAEEKSPLSLLSQCDVNMEIKGQTKPAFFSESLFMLVDKAN